MLQYMEVNAFQIVSSYVVLVEVLFDERHAALEDRFAVRQKASL